ncbi:MAG: DNA gyrase subunit A [Clostridiales Family XIII bacterium]|jgi:DNA gyrase subunit A|nr:DNA gyrase subunit A [Clostridiales Family XIII bacterium]
MTENLIEEGKLIHTEIHTEMRKAYIDYAMSVIVGRALPDVRDGLKPVHRRILFGMMELGLTPDKAYKKSARIVGDVMGKYHPHGDSSVYDAMVRMAQDFSIRYTLVDGHGNFGSVDGDAPAAMRYTEARMAKLAREMLRDIDKDTVDFMPNFDGDEREPAVLPSRIPNLLLNGSDGIAVGMATKIPPHNLKEIIDACINLIDNKEATVEDLIKIVKGPDFPTGATILGRKGIKEAYRTGNGRLTIRSKAEIVPDRKGKLSIIVSEIPYQVNKATLQEKIDELVKNKVIEGISEIRDESNREGMRLVIELKKDANANIILNRLYKNTQLQTNYSINLIALVGGEPKKLTLYDIINEYLKHQKKVISRRTKFELGKAEARAHILEGYRIALDNIDEVIRIIRSSYDNAKERLMQSFKLSEIQAQAILDMRLARLQGLERKKIDKEYNELMEKIAYLRGLLADESKLMRVIKDELIEIREKYGDKRKTDFEAEEGDINEEDLIEEKQVVVTLTNLGYIKRIDADAYKTQKRGGRGKTGLTTRKQDFVKNIITTSTHDYLTFLTNRGRVYKIKAYDIPEAGRTAKGIPVVNFLSLMSRETVSEIRPIKDFTDNNYLMMATKLGIIKKTPLSAFVNNRPSGINGIKLKDGDELIGIRETSGNDTVLIVTKKGKCISFPETDVRPVGRIAAGVRAIRLDKDDEVISMTLARPEEQLLVISKNGFGKRTAVSEYTIRKRGGKGLATYDKKKVEKTGELIAAMVASDDDEILLINSAGIIIRVAAKDIRKASRATIGVKIMQTKDDIEIISASKVVKEDEGLKTRTQMELL